MKRILTVMLAALPFFLSANGEILDISAAPQALSAGPGSSAELILSVDIREGWHINSHRVPDEYSVPTRISLAEDSPFILQDIAYPEGKMLRTEWGGRMSLYEGTIRIPLRLRAKEDIPPGEGKLRLTLSYQGCNDVTCLAPAQETLSIPVSIRVAGENDAISAPVTENAADTDTAAMEAGMADRRPGDTATAEEDAGTPGPFRNKSMFLVLLIVFVMGLALNLTPCVYPLIPVTMGFFIAQKDTRSPVLLALMYVLGLALTYSLIGTLAAFGGSMMGALLAHPATLIFFSLLMIALALSMFGLYEFKLPDSLTQVSGGSRSGAAGALIMGLTMGVVAAPCVGPFIVSLLSFVAQNGNPVTGFFTFFVLALGLGVPYVFLGIFSAKISELPRSGEWLNGIRKFFGLALIGMAIYFILPLLKGRFADYILPVYMIMAAVYYAVVDRSGLSVAWFTRLKIILSMIVLAAGILMLKPLSQPGPELSWESFSGHRYREALASEKPVIIDFYADWCNPCKELEHITFADPEVQRVLNDFERLKVDLTLAGATTDSLKKAFDIPGVPTIIFYDSSGRERSRLRLSGFERPGPFLERLEKVRD